MYSIFFTLHKPRTLSFLTQILHLLYSYVARSEKAVRWRKNAWPRTCLLRTCLALIFVSRLWGFAIWLVSEKKGGPKWLKHDGAVQRQTCGACPALLSHLLIFGIVLRHYCWPHRIIKDRIEKYGSSQSSIAAMKNILADGRWFLSPPPYTLWRTHRPPLNPIPIPKGVVCRSAIFIFSILSFIILWLSY